MAAREVVLAIAGRAALELGRLPIPQGAEQFFGAVAARVGDIPKAAYGQGSPSFADLAAISNELKFRSAKSTT